MQQPTPLNQNDVMGPRVSSILRTITVMVLMAAVAGSGGAYWFYSQSNQLLKMEVLRQLAALAPDLKFGIERANFDFSGRACLYGLSVQLPQEVEPALYIPETVITLDQQQMADFENVTIQRICVSKPVVRAIRHSTGRWNWQGIEIQNGGGYSLPDIEIEHGTVVVELERVGRTTHQMKLDELHLTALPSSSRQLKIALSMRIEPAGPLNATASLHLDGHPWTVEAQWKNLVVDEGLLQLAGDISPAISEKLQAARQSLSELAAKQAASVSTAPLSNTAGRTSKSSQLMTLNSNVQSTPSPPIVDFGLTCLCDLQESTFRQNEAGSPIVFRAVANIRNGQISNALLPFPLNQLGGSIYIDNQQTIVRDLHAENGNSKFILNARLAAGKTPEGNLTATGVEFEDSLKDRLPGSVRRMFGVLGLSGKCDFKAWTRESEQGAKFDADLRFRQATVTHEKFPYPVREIIGNVLFRDNVAEINGQGRAGGVPVTVRGIVRNPGPENESDFFIHADGIPIDAELLNASPEVVRKAMTELNLKGKGNVWLRVRRLAGLNQRFDINLEAKLRDSSCIFNGFPYGIGQLSGMLHWNGETLSFRDLKGEHDGAELTGYGTYQRTPAPGQLDLSISTKNATFDRALEAAIPEPLRIAWHEFQPIGDFDCETKVRWNPGHPCEVTLPTVTVRNAEIQMKSFPWPIRELTADLSYHAARLMVHSFNARHDDTRIHGRGRGTFLPGQPWRAEFEELFVDDLVPNSTFRMALPGALRNACETLNPTGRFSISATRPTPKDEGFPVTLSGPLRPLEDISATWNLQAVSAGCAINAGIQVEDIHGRIAMQGSMDDGKPRLEGRLDLDSISIFKLPSGISHQINRVVGPFQLRNGNFTMGSLDAVQGANEPRSSRIPMSESVTGEFIQGKLTIDAEANLNAEPEYRAKLTLLDSRLEQYAKSYLRDRWDVAGIINGWMNISGKGNSTEQMRGRGAIRIEPAALYELPLFVQIFRVLRLDAADRTAFEQADVTFTIDNSRFNFNPIDLRGNTISLRGSGNVRFDGMMDLEMVSMPPRTQLPLPFVNAIVNQFGRGLVGVQVTGQIGQPTSRVIPFPELDAAVQLLFQSRDPRKTFQNSNLRPPSVDRRSTPATLRP